MGGGSRTRAWRRIGEHIGRGGLLLALASCTQVATPNADSGAPERDAGRAPTDASGDLVSPDLGMITNDGGAPDAAPELGTPDSGPPDAGPPDSGPTDLGLPVPPNVCDYGTPLPFPDCTLGIEHASLQDAVDDRRCTRIQLGDETLIGGLRVTRPIELRGRGAGRSVLDGDGTTRVIDIELESGSGQVTLRGLSVRNGRAATGAGVRVGAGRLVMCDVVIEDNELAPEPPPFPSGTATNRGAGLFVDRNAEAVGLATVVRRNRIVVSDPDAGSFLRGAGIAVFKSTLRLGPHPTDPSRLSRVEGNVADGSSRRLAGGGIDVFDGAVVLEGVVIAGNELRARGGGEASGAGVRMFSLGTARGIQMTGGTVIADNRIHVTGSTSEATSTSWAAGFYAWGVAGRLEDVTFRRNVVTVDGLGSLIARGGGLYCHFGALDFTRVVFEENEAATSASGDGDVRRDAEGGAGAFVHCDIDAVDIVARRNVARTESMAPGPSARARGGAFYARSASIGSDPVAFIVRRALFAGNHAIAGGATAGVAAGGGLFVEGDDFRNADPRLQLENVTLSGQNVRAPMGADAFGAALVVGPGSGRDPITATLRNVTITDNEVVAPAGVGAAVVVSGVGSTVDLRSSIVSGNRAPGRPDCAVSNGGELTTGGGNAFGDGGNCTVGPADRVGGDLRLGPLADHGGHLPVHALGTGSDAIDLPGPLGCVGLDGAPLREDQRGVARPDDCDSGAYEAPSPP